MSTRNGREKGVTVSYVDCSSRKTVLSRVGRLVPEKKLEELFPRDEKGAVDDAVYAEIKGLLASGWSFSGNRLFADADFFCSYLCYRCARSRALTRSLLALTSEQELGNALLCVALLCDYCRAEWPLTDVECKLLLLGLLFHNAQLAVLSVIERVMAACRTETVGAAPRVTRSSWTCSTACATASCVAAASWPPSTRRSWCRSSWAAWACWTCWRTTTPSAPSPTPSTSR